MPWPDLLLYLGLFLNAFVAATLLPALSEVTLASLIAAERGEPFLLFLAATAGNVLGSVLNWWMGLKLLHFKDCKWFPFSDSQLARGHAAFSRYGYPALLFAWAPVIGDPLTLAAGMLRVRFIPFLVLVFIGKSMRYALVIAGINAIL
jgi:membrane protein YqaA with SNARE-associated domain